MFPDSLFNSMPDDELQRDVELLAKHLNTEPPVFVLAWYRLVCAHRDRFVNTALAVAPADGDVPQELFLPLAVKQSPHHITFLKCVRPCIVGNDFRYS